MADERDRASGCEPAEERRPTLRRLVSAASTAGGRALLIGDPGIGKSFLLRAVVAEVAERRCVLVASGLENAHRPFGVLAELMTRVSEGAMRSLTADNRLALRLLSTDRTDHGLARVADAVMQLFTVLGKTGATIVVDDWQRVDAASRRILERVLSRPSTSGSVALIAARTADGTGSDFAAHPLFTPVDVVPVPPLRSGSIKAVLEAAGVTGVGATDINDVTRASGGNPVWAIELAITSSTDDPRAYASRSATEVMRRRVLALPAHVREALTAAAATSDGLRCSDAARICRDADVAIAEGVRRRVLMLDDDTVIRAGHPLLATAALDLLDAPARRALHAALAGLQLPTCERLLHVDQSMAPGDDEGLAIELFAAAGQARRSGAVDEALLLARRALSRTPRGGQRRNERLLEIAELAFAVGDMALTVETINRIELEQVGLPAFDRAMSVLVDALDREGGQASVTRRLEGMQQVMDLHGTRWAVVEVFVLAHGRALKATVRDELLELTRSLSPVETPRTLGKALGWIGFFELDDGRGVDDDLLAQLRRLERRSNPLPIEETADAVEAIWPYQADDLSRSRAGLTTYVRAAAMSGEHYAAAQGLAHAAVVELLAGRTEIAERILAECDERVEMLSAIPPTAFRARALHALIRNDRAAVDGIVNGWLSPAAEYRGGLLRAGTAGLDAAASESWEDAVVHLDRTRAMAVSRGIEEPGRRLWIDVELGRSLIRVGDLRRAGEIASSLSALGARTRRPHLRGQGARLRALLAAANGDRLQAASLADQGLVDLERGGFVPEVIKAHLERFEMFAEDERNTKGLRSLDRARELAGRVGDPRLDDRIRAAIDGLQRDNRHGVLTAAEDRVARLAAAGRSNREIAEELFLSVRTIETHLAAVYRKLTLRSRTQLALEFNGKQASNGF